MVSTDFPQMLVTRWGGGLSEVFLFYTTVPTEAALGGTLHASRIVVEY